MQNPNVENLFRASYIYEQIERNASSLLLDTAEFMRRNSAQVGRAELSVHEISGPGIRAEIKTPVSSGRILLVWAGNPVSPVARLRVERKEWNDEGEEVWRTVMTVSMRQYKDPEFDSPYFDADTAAQGLPRDAMAAQTFAVFMAHCMTYWDDDKS